MPTLHFFLVGGGGGGGGLMFAYTKISRGWVVWVFFFVLHSFVDRTPPPPPPPKKKKKKKKKKTILVMLLQYQYTLQMTSLFSFVLISEGRTCADQEGLSEGGQLNSDNVFFC